MSELIQVKRHTTQSGMYIGEIALNNPNVLNAQNLEMVRAIKQILTEWQSDESVAMVLLRGQGDRAMCAGGDIKSLYAGDCECAKEFFEEEYGLMYIMHTYAKPILAWGNGIVMGGGLGLFCASSHKVVTENTLMAMPEVSIGLFPDAGASYFLNRLTNRLGLFLGLTGVKFSGADAIDMCLADFAIRHDEFDKVLEALIETEFVCDDAQNYCLLSDCLYEFHNITNLPRGQLISRIDEIDDLMQGDELSLVDRRLQSYKGTSNLINSAVENYKLGSSITKLLTWKIYHKLKKSPSPVLLKDILDMEAKVAVNCVAQGDFKEGVRALLIDKDKSPQWKYASIDEISDEFIEGFFV